MFKRVTLISCLDFKIVLIFLAERNFLTFYQNFGDVVLVENFILQLLRLSVECVYSLSDS